MKLTQVEEKMVRLYRGVKDHGYGRLEVRVEGNRGTFIRAWADYKVEKLNDDAED